MAFNPSVWGPHYWFVLQSIALCYPATPNDVTKKKYYDFIQNLPLFIPHKEIGNEFIEILNKFPVTPYLDSRLSFLKWMNFVHNKINMKMGEPSYRIIRWNTTLLRSLQTKRVTKYRGITFT